METDKNLIKILEHACKGSIFDTKPTFLNDINELLEFMEQYRLHHQPLVNHDCAIFMPNMPSSATHEVIALLIGKYILYGKNIPENPDEFSYPVMVQHAGAKKGEDFASYLQAFLKSGYYVSMETRCVIAQRYYDKLNLDDAMVIQYANVRSYDMH